MHTLTLRSGYDRRRNAPATEYRYMTHEEARLLTAGDTVEFVARDGTARRLRINGKPKTWKRDASRLEIPVKYGLRECGTFYADNVSGHIRTWSSPEICLIARV